MLPARVAVVSLGESPSLSVNWAGLYLENSKNLVSLQSSDWFIHTPLPCPILGTYVEDSKGERDGLLPTPSAHLSLSQFSMVYMLLFVFCFVLICTCSSLTQGKKQCPRHDETSRKAGNMHRDEQPV